MLRPSLVVIAALFGMGLAAEITELRKLWVLSVRGTEVTGEVLAADAAPRGVAVIRIISGSNPVEVSEPCVGFPCNVGARVQVTLLPGEPSVRVVGNITEKFRTALVATFLISPMLFSVGVAYSLRRNRTVWARSVMTTIIRVLLRLLPVLMSLGVVLSTAIALILSGKLGRFQIVASISVTLGSAFYLAALKKPSSHPVAMQRTLAAILFGIGAILIILDFAQRVHWSS